MARVPPVVDAFPVVPASRSCVRTCLKKQMIAMPLPILPIDYAV